MRVVFLGSSGLFLAGASQALSVSHCPLSLTQDSCPVAGSYVVAEADFNPFITCPGFSGPSLHQPQEAALSLKLVSDLLTPACWLVCFSSDNRAPSSWSTLPGPAFCPRDSSGAIYGKRFPWIWDLGVPRRAQAPCPRVSSPSAQFWGICRGHTEVGGRARPAPRVCQGLHLHGSCLPGCSHQ